MSVKSGRRKGENLEGVKVAVEGASNTSVFAASWFGKMIIWGTRSRLVSEEVMLP